MAGWRGRLKLAGFRDAVEELAQPRLADGGHETEVVFEDSRLVESADRDRVVACVANELFRHLDGFVVPAVEAARGHALLSDSVVEPGEVRIEGLRDGSAGDGLDLRGQRLELLVSPSEGVGRVDGGLSLD